MNKICHTSAKPSHYNQEAKNYYDELNEENSIGINQFIGKTLEKYKVKTVLDLTCGTGSQVFWLNKHGFDIVGSDFNMEMLKIAKSKSVKLKKPIKFIQGDMRTIKAGKFDAAITIFNAIGHLTKSDFEKTIRNAHDNLNHRGLYIFDIFNLNYLLKDDNITKLTIDWLTRSKDVTVREIQYSTISQDGVLASYDIYHQESGSNKPKISTSFQTLQVYTAQQLKKMLENNGFEVLRQCGIDDSRFYESKSERILTIARRN